MAQKQNLQEKKTGKTSHLVVAKVLALAAFCVVILFFLVEVFSIAVYGLPLLLTEVAKYNGVKTGADWVLGMILWGFPSLFLTLLVTGLHWVMLRAVFGRMGRWVVRVLKQTGRE